MPLPKKTYKLRTMDEILALDVSELKNLVNELRAQIAQVRIYSDPKTNPRFVDKHRLKKSLARVLTVLNRYKQATNLVMTHNQPEHQSDDQAPPQPTSSPNYHVTPEQTVDFLSGKLANTNVREQKLILAKSKQKRLAKRSRHQYLRRASRHHNPLTNQPRSTVTMTQPASTATPTPTTT